MIVAYDYKRGEPVEMPEKRRKHLWVIASTVINALGFVLPESISGMGCRWNVWDVLHVLMLVVM